MKASKHQLAAPRGSKPIWRAGRWQVRIRYANGVRKWTPLAQSIGQHEVERATTEAARLARIAVEGGYVIDDEESDPLVLTWFERYLGWKAEKGQAVAARRSHLRIWISPVLGSKTMRSVTRRDLEAFVQMLDREVSLAEIRWRTAGHIWGSLATAFKDAARCKNLDLRVLDESPVRDIVGPDKGQETAKVHLFPEEFLSLVRCEDVPLVRRRAYAIAVYMYLRPGELEALDWRDIVPTKWIVTIQRSISHERGGIPKSPKAGIGRSPMDVEPELIPLLEAMHRESNGVGRVVGSLGDEREYAAVLRQDLLTAGATRRELHESSDDPPRSWMTMHDLRTTGITWMAVRGDSVLAVMARAGHSDIKMTQHYVAEAALLRRGYGTPFPPLPPSIVGRPALRLVGGSEPSRHMLGGSGRQGTRRDTGSDRPHRVDDGEKEQVRFVECCHLILVRFFHVDLLGCVGSKVRCNCVSHGECDHEEDDQEPVSGEEGKPQAADPLRPEPANGGSVWHEHVPVKHRRGEALHAVVRGQFHHKLKSRPPTVRRLCPRQVDDAQTTRRDLEGGIIAIEPPRDCPEDAPMERMSLRRFAGELVFKARGLAPAYRAPGRHQRTLPPAPDGGIAVGSVGQDHPQNLDD